MLRTTVVHFKFQEQDIDLFHAADSLLESYLLKEEIEKISFLHCKN